MLISLFGYHYLSLIDRCGICVVYQLDGCGQKLVHSHMLKKLLVLVASDIRYLPLHASFFFAVGSYFFLVVKQGFSLANLQLLVSEKTQFVNVASY